MNPVMKPAEIIKYLQYVDKDKELVIISKEEYSQLIKIKQKYLRIKTIIFSEAKK